jgi:predicted ATPase
MVTRPLADKPPLIHRVGFGISNWRFVVLAEMIEEISTGSETSSAPCYVSKFGEGELRSQNGQMHEIKVESDASILSRIRDPNNYPELTALSDAYDDIRIFRDWTFGRSSALRTAQPTDMPADRLAEDFSNLAMFCL